MSNGELTSTNRQISREKNIRRPYSGDRISGSGGQVPGPDLGEVLLDRLVRHHILLLALDQHVEDGDATVVDRPEKAGCRIVVSRRRQGHQVTRSYAYHLTYV